jgi:hypothetical protein
VVTEIAYHAKKTIDADISFLSEGEWKQELEVLLDDLVDEDGNIKRSTDMKSDAGVAWSKVTRLSVESSSYSHVYFYPLGSCGLSHYQPRAASRHDC